MMKAFFTLLLCTFLLACSTEQTQPVDPNAPRPFPFKIIDSGQNSGLATQKFFTMVDEQEFRTFWSIHSQPSKSSIPKINFKTSSVVAAFMGEQLTGGYSINIEAMTELARSIMVAVKMTRPAPGSARTMQITQPYVLAVIPKTKKPVSFHFITKE